VATNSRTRGNYLEDLLKGRIAEALVEAIFRRAGYVVSHSGRETQFTSLMRDDRDAFLPDFLIRKVVEREGQRPLHQLIPVEVKYRRDLHSFLRRDVREFCAMAAAGWPDLSAVFVTDNPAPGRSCFQIVDLRGGPTSTTRDLHHVSELDIYETTVREYERLVHAIFPLLGRATSGVERPRGWSVSG
jgi:hypothetical protein